MLKAKRSRNSEPVPSDDYFSSLDVSRITGVSLRQLQWWDEQGVVSPQQRGHKRLYKMQEVIEVGLITELRLKGISLQKIRRVLKYLQKEFGAGLFDAVQNGHEIHLLTDGKHVYLEDSHRNIVNILKNARQPIISVCVSDQVERLSTAVGLKKQAKSEVKAGVVPARVVRAS